MPVPMYIVDAFAPEPFTGNSAGVCILEQALPERLMQKVAAELGISETAYVQPLEGNNWSLRWFTPTVEVDLCGHATLATAHVLFESGRVSQGVVNFHTLSGVLVCRHMGELIEMDFPAEPPQSVDPPPMLIEGLGVRPAWVGKNRWDYIAVCESEDTVRTLRPDLTKLGRLPVRGVAVTAQASEGAEFDFVSRFFAPQSGIPEDPVTGSAHCGLGPYWSAKLGRNELIGYQASPRTGQVGTRVHAHGVTLSGKAFTVLRGELLI